MRLPAGSGGVGVSGVGGVGGAAAGSKLSRTRSLDAAHITRTQARVNGTRPSVAGETPLAKDAIRMLFLSRVPP